MAGERPRASRFVVAMSVVGVVVLAVAVGLAVYLARTVVGSMDDREQMEAHDLAAARAATASVRETVTLYRSRFHECPQIGEDLVTAGLLEQSPRDPWGRNLVFVCDDDHVRVVSPGLDGRLGTGDDVSAP